MHIVFSLNYINATSMLNKTWENLSRIDESLKELEFLTIGQSLDGVIVPEQSL